jgi:zinc transport system permease protein
MENDHIHDHHDHDHSAHEAHDAHEAKPVQEEVQPPPHEAHGEAHQMEVHDVHGEHHGHHVYTPIPMHEISMVDIGIVGIGFSLMAGLLGCFVVWRRMAYFGDSLAHSSLLGIAVGMAYGISDQPAMLLSGIAFAGLLVWLKQRQRLAMDTLLGILSHAGLALGMLAIHFSAGEQLDIHDVLFGEILKVRAVDAWWIAGAAVLVGLVMWRLWTQFVLAALNEDLARAEGIRVDVLQFLLMVLMALVVAVSIHAVGVLLITSMLIIPAAASRLFARSPESMALGAMLIAALSMLGGVSLSLALAMPSGPTVVTVAIALFLSLMLLQILVKRA